MIHNKKITKTREKFSTADVRPTGPITLIHEKLVMNGSYFELVMSRQHFPEQSYLEIIY
jgi:hypothetical protein